MSVRKAPLILLVVSVVTLAARGSAVNARLSESASPAAAGPHLGSEITISATDDVQYEPDIAYNHRHNEYLVVWRNADGIHGQRITGYGQLTGLSAFRIAGGTTTRRDPAVAYDPVNDRYLVVWTHDIEGDGSNWDLSGRFVPWGGPTSDLLEFKINSGSRSQWRPKISYSRDKGEFFIVWAEKPGLLTSSDIYGQRIDAEDGTTTALPWRISPVTKEGDFPDVSYSGVAQNEYVVTWNVRESDSWNVNAARLRDDGAQIDEIVEVAAESQDDAYPVVATCDNADQYLIVWEHTASSTDHDIYGRFITGDGALDGGDFPVYNTGNLQQVPDVACAQGGRYLVTWQQGQNTDFGIEGRLIFTDKSMGSEFTLVEPAAGASRDAPAVAGGSSNHLVAWQHDREGTTYQDIHGRLISASVTFLPVVLRNS